MNTLPESLYTGYNNHAESRYDSLLALRAIPDYEPLKAHVNYINVQKGQPKSTPDLFAGYFQSNNQFCSI